MAESHLHRIESIFQAAADLPADQRPAYLDAHCDPKLRAEVETLLALHEKPADDIITRGAFAASALPERIGSYRIIRLLGQGGMGAVYEAEQDNPRRSIALKVIRPGLLAPSLLSRFRREAELLARLHHPGIAQIFEAGTQETPGGPTPFFAMELIRGQPLDLYARTLTTPQKLSLFAHICDAVQHAHESGILHRDLKPANILVEHASEPRPRILDFGIARDTGAQDLTIRTEVGQLLGTLPYMSPEQVSGKSIDTRSDIYSLGIILYELLTGRLPYDIRHQAVPEAARIIRDQEPTRLASIDTLLRGDIDTIVAKAIDKDPARRYASAADLAADIRRHLGDQPIIARPPSALYQLGKFARRNRALVISAAIVFLALTIGLAVSTSMYLKAEHARAGEADESRLANSVVNYFISDIIGAAAPNRDGYNVKVIDVLNRAADGIGARFKDRPALEARLHIELAHGYNNLALAEKAESHARRALELLAPIAPGTDEQIIRAEFHLCSALGQQHKDQDRADRAAAALARADGLKPGDNNRIRLAAEQAKGLQSLRRHDQAQTILKQALASSPDEDTAAMLRLELLTSLSSQDKLEETLPLSAELLAHNRKTLGPTHPGTLASLNNHVNLLSRAKHYNEAADAAAELPALVEKTFPPNHPARGYSNLTFASALLNANKAVEAEAPAIKATEAFPDLSYERERAYSTLADIYAALNRTADLERATLRLLRQRLVIAGPGEAPSITAAFEAAQKRTNLSDLPARLWEARETFATGPARARFSANLARHFLTLSNPTQASEALADARQALPSSTRRTEDEQIINAVAAQLSH